MDRRGVESGAAPGAGGNDGAGAEGEAIGGGSSAVAIEVSVPMLLSDCTNGKTRFSLEAATLAEALERLVGEHPLLRRHLYTEQGRVRQHVLLFLNEENIAWLERLDVPLRAGDRLRVLQAVSGG
ncbi:MoaD/ThiS family protein [Paenibacillus sp. TRM 82003]|nr:MoaD/ThiS family protein [Paenibacillus sp. TRM 82003]